MRFTALLVTTLSLLLSTARVYSSTACQRRWCRQPSQCVNSTSPPLSQKHAPTLHACLLAASGTTDDLLLEWNERTGVCSLFHYQQVCRNMLSSGSSDTSPVCSVYRSAALVSCRAQQSLTEWVNESSLLGVWLAGGSSRFSNLVCQSEPTNYRLEAWNLRWTEEGAEFDGVSSYALLNDSRLASVFQGGSFTWLIRLKRQVRSQPFLELESCSNPDSVSISLLEVENKQLYFTTAKHMVSNFGLLSQESVMPNDSATFVNLASTMPANSTQSDIFVDDRFVGRNYINTPSGVAATCLRLLVGISQDSSGRSALNGTVRAVAVVNATLTERQIQHLFSLFP